LSCVLVTSFTSSMPPTLAGLSFSLSLSLSLSFSLSLSLSLYLFVSGFPSCPLSLSPSPSLTPPFTLCRTIDIPKLIPHPHSIISLSHSSSFFFPLFSRSLYLSLPPCRTIDIPKLTPHPHSIVRVGVLHPASKRVLVERVTKDGEPPLYVCLSHTLSQTLAHNASSFV